MKLDAIIIRDVTNDGFTGFVKQYPGVCTQSKDIDTVMKNLDKYLKFWFDYSSKNTTINANTIIKL